MEIVSFRTGDTKSTKKKRRIRFAGVPQGELHGIRVSRNMGTYMNITLSLPEELVKRVRKIAVDRDTTLTGLVREYLNELARQEAAAGRKRREREALERSFGQFQYRVGNRIWKREDLHERA